MNWSSYVHDISKHIFGAKFSSAPSYSKIDIFNFRLWCLTFSFVDIGSFRIGIGNKWSYLPPDKKVGKGHQGQCSLWLHNDTLFLVYWPKYDYIGLVLCTRVILWAPPRTIGLHKNTPRRVLRVYSVLKIWIFELENKHFQVS